MIVNYNRKTFTVQATGEHSPEGCIQVLSLPKNIRLGYKGLPGTNTRAHLPGASEKRYIGLTPEGAEVHGRRAMALGDEDDLGSNL